MYQEAAEDVLILVGALWIISSNRPLASVLESLGVCRWQRRLEPLIC